MLFRSNALENALNATEKIPHKALRYISVSATIKNGNLLLVTENPYIGTIEFENGIPQTQNCEDGHGFGVKNIVSITNKHKGVYLFYTIDNNFILKLILPLQK